MNAHADLPGRDGPIVLFDGICRFCSGSVVFILKRDVHRRFRFAPLQGVAGQRLLAQFALPVDALETLVLVDGNRYWSRSAAVIEILRRLGGLWSAARVLTIVPRSVRDVAYDLFARRRYRWFGARDSCFVPSPEVRARFLE